METALMHSRLLRLSGAGEVSEPGLLYGVIYPEFLKELGYSNLNEVDSDLKSLFFFEHKPNHFTGEIEKKLKSKSEATKEELNKYIQDVIQFGNTEFNFNFDL